METKEMIVELLWSPSLPEHYVAVDDSGSRWLIPVAPIGPAAWERRVPYAGNYFLKAVVPDVVRSFYQPQPAA